MDLTSDKIVALCGQALALGQLDKAEELARAYLDTCQEYGSDDPAVRGVIGAVCLEQGRYQEALLEYSLTIKWGGPTADRLYALGLVYQKLGDLKKAAMCWAQGVDLFPDHQDLAVNAVQAALQLEMWEEAIKLCERILPVVSEKHMPSSELKDIHALPTKTVQDCPVIDPRLYLWLGHACAKLFQTGKSINAYRQAVRFMPDNVSAWFMLGLGLRDLRAFSEAETVFQTVLQLEPGHVEAKFELAQLQLMDGRWLSGFDLWESRLLRSVELLPSDLPSVRWDGNCINDQTLLVQAEQGFGDTLQFSRYLPLLINRAGKVVLRVHAQLQRLLQQAYPQFSIVSFDQGVQADCYIPLLSLPSVLSCSDCKPDTANYLSGLLSKKPMSPSLSSSQSSLRKIAVVWRGNPAHHNDGNRSSSLKAFSKLGHVPDCQFHHFQMDFDASDDDQAATELWPDLRNGVDGVIDFLDTAKRLSACDLVIGVDTALVHLSSAMGLPTWVVVPYVPDWRWGRSGATTPWYENVQVWRQNAPGDWPEVVSRMRQALSSFTPVR